MTDTPQSPWWIVPSDDSKPLLGTRSKRPRDYVPVACTLWPWLLGGGLLFFLFVEAETMVIRFRRRSSAPSPAVSGSAA